MLSCGGIKSGNMLNQELTEELQKPMIRKFEKQKVPSSLKTISVILIQYKSKFNKRFQFLLCVIGSYSKFV